MNSRRTANLDPLFDFDSEDNFYTVSAKELKGAYMLLDEASVTGTANIIMAAVLAKGTTSIYNAACEPYLQQLCKMLNSMGANITGIGSNLIKINGVKKLGGCFHRVLPDMIEIGSFIGLAAMTGSEITIKDVSWENLGLIPNVFRKLGITLEKRGDDIYIPSQDNYEIETFIDGDWLKASDTTLGADKIILLVRDISKWSSFRGQIYEWASGSLGSSNGNIRLLNPEGEERINLSYSSTYPWPTLSSQYNYPIHLPVGVTDFKQAENWKLSVQYGGTPGLINERYKVKGLVINEFMARNQSTLQDGFDAASRQRCNKFIYHVVRKGI